MTTAIIYRTSGSPSAWSNWYFSAFDTVEETERDLTEGIESRHGSWAEFAERNSNGFYSSFEVVEIEGKCHYHMRLIVDDLNGCPYAREELQNMNS